MSMFACYFRRVKFCNEVGMLGKNCRGGGGEIDNGKWKMENCFRTAKK